MLDDFTPRSCSESALVAMALMLYVGEGAKSGQTVDFVNSDPQTILFFTTFLRKICRVDERRLKLYLYCWSDQNVYALIDFWCDHLHVAPVQFTKPCIRQSNTKLLRRSIRGVIHVRYSDKKLLELINRLGREYMEKYTLWAGTEVVNRD